MGKARKILIVLLLLAGVCGTLFYFDQSRREKVSFSAFLSDTLPPEQSNTADVFSGDSAAAWTICWYLCGGDLETEDGFATEDLLEMFSVPLPERVRVVVQTGGAKYWHNDQIDAGNIQRWIWQSGGLSLLETLPRANMGETETLSRFLRFCRDAFPAEHTAVIIWNHGGGTTSGTAFDENYGNDALTLDEFRTAFADVYPLSAENPPLDLLGFDACLMATIDAAAAFSDTARCLAASEEMEPGSGWYYTGWLEVLAENPSIDAETLGRVLCDTYLEGCEREHAAGEATFSLINLERLAPLLEAYEDFGRAALCRTLDDPAFLAELGRAAFRTENYGGNNPGEGYANLLDLGHFARNCAAFLPEESANVLQALDSCVVYRVNGLYRPESSGLSCYYSYNGDPEDFAAYREAGTGTAFKALFDYALDGVLEADSAAYVKTLGYTPENLPPVPAFHDGVEAEPSVYVDEDGIAVLDVGAEKAARLKAVYFLLFYLDREADTVLWLGRDNDLYMDWENGVFEDNFWGMWGAIDGHLAYMDIVYEGEGYNAYSVPILLNGTECHLRVIYRYDSGEYQIIGARRGLDEETGMADRNLIQLRPGDEITTILYLSSLDGEDDFAPYEVDTFSVTAHTAFEDMDMGDGEFMMRFELVDARNASVYSRPVYFTVDGDDIYAEN